MDKNKFTMSKPMQIAVGLLIVVMLFFIIIKPGKKEEPKQLSRTEIIEKAFSALDGSHLKLKEYIKTTMNDPKSYEEVETKYWDRDSFIVVKMTFTGKNAFGGRVKQTVMANCDIDGNVIKIMAAK